jgi:uridine kinase
MEVAFKQCFPGGVLTIDHSVSSGGYFCQVEGVPDFSKADLTRLEAAMRELVRQNVAFVRETVPLQEAIDYFVSAGEDTKCAC